MKEIKVERFALSDGKRMAGKLTEWVREGAEFVAILSAGDGKHCIVVLAVDVPDR